MSQNNFLLFAFLLSIYPPTLPALTQLLNSDPGPIMTQPLHLPNPSPPSTIPAFPEESNVDGCPLDLPNELFSGIKSACGSHKFDPNSYSGQLHKTRCCPVLAAWLYSAYSKTALKMTPQTTSSSQVDMPLLPDDSETCVDSLEKALVNRGVILVNPNETCDFVSCYCGIRLHTLSCPEAFFVNSHDGKLIGGENVNNLEKDCTYPGIIGCSKCLNSLYLLNEDKGGNTSKLGDRKSKMHSKECDLMGLTWLLHKNRTAYIHTVSAVLRALMLSTEGTYPDQSCTLNSDGMPLAVDSSEIDDQSSSSVLHTSLYLYLLLFGLLFYFFDV